MARLRLTMFALFALSAASTVADTHIEAAGTVRFVEDLGTGSCVSRLVVGKRPEDILDVQASGQACRDLASAVGRQVKVSGRCLPVFTVYGSLCRPVVETVSNAGR